MSQPINRPDTELLGIVATTLLKVVMQMPDPLPRFFMDALDKEVPELHEEIKRTQQLSVPFLQLHESRRTTMHESMGEGTIRFSSILITGETDNGQLVCWPQFQIDKLPRHDMDMLALSLSDWLQIIRRKINEQSRPVKIRVINEIKPEIASRGEENLL